MRIFSVVVSCGLSLMCMVGNAEQARGEVNRDGVFESLDNMEAAHAGTLAHLQRHRDMLGMMLGALGAELKTVAEWRTEWAKSGKTERIARYLKGKADSTRLWYLSQNKAHAAEMAAMGMGDIRIGYVEHWYKFQELADEYNEITQNIRRLMRLQFIRDIKHLRKRLRALNGDLGAVHEDIVTLRKQVKEQKKIVKRLLEKVNTQNFGLQLVLAFLHGALYAWGEIDEDADDTSSCADDDTPC